jgi:hypothetical protein
MRPFILGGIKWGRFDGVAKKANTSSTGNGTHWLVSRLCVMGFILMPREPVGMGWPFPFARQVNPNAAGNVR